MSTKPFVGSPRTNPHRPQVFTPSYGVTAGGNRRFPVLKTPQYWRVEFSGGHHDFPTHAEAIQYADKLVRESK